MAYKTNVPEELPADSHDNHTRAVSTVAGKITEVMTVTLKPITQTGSSGKLVFTNGALTSRTDPT